MQIAVTHGDLILVSCLTDILIGSQGNRLSQRLRTTDKTTEEVPRSFKVFDQSMATAHGMNGGVHNEANLDLATIIQALQIVHNPQSPNKQRQQASNYLEGLKQIDGIARSGFVLANDINQQPIVRHFGITLLEHVVKRQSFVLDEHGSQELRQLVLQLSSTLIRTPQAYIRNKIAALWVELAKRSWALDWFDLDEILVQLWNQSTIQQEFVLSVLENLSEDCFVRDDPSAMLRDQDLNNAVVEIFTPAESYSGGLMVGGTMHKLRSGDEGWTQRITNNLAQSLQSAARDGTRMSVACLGSLRSISAWIMSPAFVGAGTMSVVCQALTQSDPDLVMAAIDMMMAFYGRAKLEEIEVVALVHPLCEPSSVKILLQVYESSVVGVDDILDIRYSISKRMAELFHHLAHWLTQYPPADGLNMQPFLEALIEIARHDSLIVAIAAVHAWERFLQATKWRRTAVIQACIQPALQVAMERIIAYELMPGAAEIPSVVFVNEEIELFPERQGFHSNFRRFCFSIIEWISYTFLEDALSYIISIVDQNLSQIAQDEQESISKGYNKWSLNALRSDAQFTAVDAAFKGICRWIDTRESDEDPATLAKRDDLRHKARVWSTDMLGRYHFRDPAISTRQVRHVVETASRLLDKDNEFAFKVLHHIMSTFEATPTEDANMLEARSDLHAYSILELRRLCAEHASYFIPYYDQLESKLTEVLDSGLDMKFQDDLKASLMLLIEHAEGIDGSVRKDRLQSFIQPLEQAWRERSDVLASFEDFVRHGAFDHVGPYLTSIKALVSNDWTLVPLDEQARSIQATMDQAAKSLPLRRTRVLLSTSTDRMHDHSPILEVIQDIWRPLLLTIVPIALSIIAYNHKLHDPMAWPHIEHDQHALIRRILRDRYWQSGISGGSMNEFREQIKATKNSLEGFASSVRGRIRVNLENCYSIIHTLGRLGSTFYGLAQVPEMVAAMLISSADPLSPHHFGILLSMMPKLIEECPVQDRQHFLTPVLSTLLSQIDRKLTAEWEQLAHRDLPETANGEDNVTDEMRDESVLRQTTSKAVSLVSMWIDPQRELKLANSRRIVNGASSLSASQSLREFVLSNRVIMEPLLLFCSHAVSYRDTKCSTTIIVTLQKLVPAFSTETYLSGVEAQAVRDFISTQSLRSAITSLHDGYFADNQTNLAILIALIWISYGLPSHVPATTTESAYTRPAWTTQPQDVLLSVPGLDRRLIEQSAHKLAELGLSGSHRRMRAVILTLLDGLRGIRVSELGKYDTKQEQNSLLEKYKQRDGVGMPGVEAEPSLNRGDEGDVDLNGVADMFS